MRQQPPKALRGAMPQLAHLLRKILNFATPNPNSKLGLVTTSSFILKANTTKQLQLFLDLTYRSYIDQFPTRNLIGQYFLLAPLRNLALSPPNPKTDSFQIATSLYLLYWSHPFWAHPLGFRNSSLTKTF